MKNQVKPWQPETFFNFTSNPFRAMNDLQKQMDHYFEELSSTKENSISLTNRNIDFIPSYDIQETDSQFLVCMDVPGVKKEDIKVEIKNSTLTIAGERRDEKEKKDKSSYHSECYYGSFARSIHLGSSIKADQIEAYYAEGVLRLVLPKAETVKSQNIKVADGKPAAWGKILTKGDASTASDKKVVKM